MGVTPTAVQPNTDYDGYRVKSDDRPEIYLVMFGYRRWIPNPATYNNLFRDWNGILRFPNRDALDNAIPEGAGIWDGAVLARGATLSPVYLITDNVRMWVTAPAVMDKYYFAWNKVVVVPNAIIQSIYNGASLS